jgi:hypothetical protein
VLGVSASVGQIATGMQADLLVVGGNPLDHIEDISNTRCTIKAGQRLDPAELMARHREFCDEMPDDPITRDLMQRVGLRDK